MEHRWSPRKAVKMDVFINYRPLGLVRGETRDISLEGMFVETGRIALPKNEAVDISFTLQHEKEAGVHHLGAYVVHSSDKGVGLMFRDFQSSVFRALEDVIFDNEDHREHAS